MLSSPHTFHIFHYISNYIYIFTYYEFTFSITFPITFTFSLTMNLHFALHFQSHLHFHLLCFCFLLCFCPCILISCYMFAAFSFTFGQPITIPSAILVTFILQLELLSNIRTFYTHGRHNPKPQSPESRTLKPTRTPQGPFNRSLMALNNGYLGYIRG